MLDKDILKIWLEKISVESRCFDFRMKYKQRKTKWDNWKPINCVFYKNKQVSRPSRYMRWKLIEKSKFVYKKRKNSNFYFIVSSEQGGKPELSLLESPLPSSDEEV